MIRQMIKVRAFQHHPTLGYLLAKHRRQNARMQIIIGKVLEHVLILHVESVFIQLILWESQDVDTKLLGVHVGQNVEVFSFRVIVNFFNKPNVE